MTDPIPNSRRDEALQFLYGRLDYERTAAVPYRLRGFKLERMRRFLERLGNPQQRLPAIHIAGTKGKGSTAAMLSSALTQAGHQIGLYTSPHLHGLEERLRIADQPCPKSHLVELIERVRPVVAELDEEARHGAEDETGPTYFEITTALALLYFVDRQVDAAVLEVGLGGRLDSTNVCSPVLTIITSISLDHTQQLGNTIAEIAREKAGILKPSVPLVTGVTDPVALAEIESIARSNRAECEVLGRDFRFDNYITSFDELGESRQPSTVFDYEHPARRTRLHKVRLSLLGKHQVANAAVAIAALQRLKQANWDVSESSVRDGMTKLDCPARIEMVAQRPAVLVDAAHNVASVEALIEVLRESLPAAGRRILVFATSRDKDAKGMLTRLLPEFDQCLLTRFRNNPRSADPQTLFNLAVSLTSNWPQEPRLELFSDPETAWSRIGEIASPDDLVCITGSFYLAAELRLIAMSNQAARTAISGAAQ